VPSVLPSSTSRISSTHPGGKSASVAARVRSALYAGKTAMTLCSRLNAPASGWRIRSTRNAGWAGRSGGSGRSVGMNQWPGGTESATGHDTAREELFPALAEWCLTELATWDYAGAMPTALRGHAGHDPRASYMPTQGREVVR